MANSRQRSVSSQLAYPAEVKGEKASNRLMTDARLVLPQYSFGSFT